MGAPFILTLLSSDGYQVFAALHREYPTIDEAVEGAKDDYLRRYGGNPSFRVYHAERDESGFRHTLIEACFDESKRRSFVALYKVLQEVEAAPKRLQPTRLSLAGCGRMLRRLLIRLGHLLDGPGGSDAVIQFR
jgi:hypothetical protein